MQLRSAHRSAPIFTLLVLLSTGCRTMSAWQPPCLTLNQGGAYQQSLLPFARSAPAVQTDLANPSVVRGRSRVTPAPLPTGELQQESSVAGTGYRPEETEERQTIRRQTQELDQLPKEAVPPRHSSSSGLSSDSEVSSDSGSTSGPELAPGRSAPQVKLSVESIESIPVSGEVSFKITLTNSGGTPAEDVVLQCDFDEKLTFPGREELGIIQRLGRLDPGESKSVDLSLLGRTEGESEVLFTARSTNVNAVTPVTRKLTIVPQALFLELSGSGHARVGDRLAYKLSVRNSSDKPLANVTLILSADVALKPRLAQGDPEQLDRGWSWNFAELAPGETRTFDVALECLSTAQAAQVKIVGTADGIPSDTLQATIEILPTPKPPMTRLNPPEIDLGQPESF